MPSHDDAARAERARIRREIHDTIGHHLTVIAYCSAAADGASALPDPARVAIGQIRDSVSAALRDLRLVLDDLDDPGTGDADRPATHAVENAEVASLEEFHELVRGVASAGLRARLDVDSGLRQGGRDVPRAALRIVQEALTNSLRHGSATDSRIALESDGHHLTVLVVDNGQPSASIRGSATVTHRGLAGMRARARDLAGDVLAGPLPDGGFQVRARLPWTAPVAEAWA